MTNADLSKHPDPPNDIGLFRDALVNYEIDLPDEAIGQLHDYCQLVWKMNQRINLTRHVTYDLFVTRDVLDAVKVAALLEADEEVLDIGSGGGVPGILLAILRPDIEVSVCDSVGKKATVLKSIVKSLELPVPVYGERAEKVLDDFRFSTLTARAVGPLPKMLTWFQDHWHSIGRLVLIKGPQWVRERGDARHRGLLADLDLRRLVSYQTPGHDGESVVLSIERRRPSRDG